MQVIDGRFAQDPLLAHMMKCLFFICACQQFSIVAKHTSGKDNVAADTIPCNNMQLLYFTGKHATALFHR